MPTGGSRPTPAGAGQRELGRKNILIFVRESCFTVAYQQALFLLKDQIPRVESRESEYFVNQMLIDQRLIQGGIKRAVTPRSVTCGAILPGDVSSDPHISVVSIPTFSHRSKVHIRASCVFCSLPMVCGPRL